VIDDAWLALLSAAPPHTRRWPGLIARYGSAQAVLRLSRAALAEHGVAEAVIDALREPDEQRLALWQRWLDGSAARSLIPLGSPAYPQRLTELPDPPLALWCEGQRPELLSGPQLAIVGSRNPTRSGRQTAEQFARAFSQAGLTITSGLACGIDGASHRGGLDGVGRTIAVLGSGPDEVFPRSHLSLSRSIIADGVLVSEYPPGTKPLPFHFPQRNRIIAGLSLGTLVVEATRHSGSLVTARRALEMGREVFAIPGSIHSPLARGCHALIRSGAKLVEDAADVLSELRSVLELDLVASSEPAEEPVQASLFDDPGYRELLNRLDFSPIAINDLARGGGLTAAELSSMLLLLEMEGYVEALPGGRYARTAKRSR
jgi:DNA processing protein